MNETKVKDRETFLSDIVTTAIEGGIGYWSECLEYAWYWADGTNSGPAGAALGPSPNGGDNAYAKIVEIDGEDPNKTYEITGKTIAAAFTRMAADSRVYRDQSVIPYLNPRTRDRLLKARDELEAGDIDAGDADTLVQVALFGEVVYG